MNAETLPELVETKGGLPAITYTPDQVALIKRMYAKDASDDELAAFMYAAKRLKLDIIARQIHFTKRQGKPVFIVAIDGYRLNAERTGQYAPGREPSFTYDDKKSVVSATAYVKKLIGGEWHEVAATAFMEEYKPSEDSSAFMWKKMPHNQLAKCAEALALRRAFPNELGDTITDDEAAQTREPEGKAPIKPAAAKSDSPYTFTFVPTDVDERTGGGEGDKKNEGKDPAEKGYVKAWTKWGVKLPDGEFAGTFSEEYGPLLIQARDEKKSVVLTWKADGKYRTIAELRLA